ncbi:MAG: DUF1611 domain-containing protein [bacterium]
MTISRRMLILTEGKLGVFDSKTATCLVRYCPDEVVGLLDSKHVGVRTSEVLGVNRDIPVVARVSDALRFHPTCLVIGTAPQGGSLTTLDREHVLDAVKNGLDVISGLHTMLNEDEEIASAAGLAGANLWDVRKPPSGIPIACARARRTKALRILTAGVDCNVGKMVTAYELSQSLKTRCLDACFIPTGQTGIIIAGWGIAVDRIISDFAAGAVEQLVLEQAESDVVVVEGQGSLIHPAYSAVALALLHGALPDGVILCHQPGRTRLRGNEEPVAPLKTHIDLYERASAPLHPAKIIGIALNGFRMSDKDLQREIERIREETGLPTTDVIRFGTKVLADAVEDLKRNG